MKEKFKFLSERKLSQLSPEKLQEYNKLKEEHHKEMGQIFVDALKRGIAKDHIMYVEAGECSTPPDDFFYEALKKRAKWLPNDKFLRLNPKIERAIATANLVHKNQWEKGHGFKSCYVSHPLRVAEILSKYTQDENTIIAGLLHDTILNSDYVLGKKNYDYTLEELEKDFGKEIKIIVENLIIDKNASWDYKNKVYLGRMNESDSKVLMVLCADCIDNLRFFINMYERGVNDFFLKDYDTFNFNAPVSEIVGFYEKILNILKDKLDGEIVNELENTLKETKDYLVKHDAEFGEVIKKKLFLGVFYDEKWNAPIDVYLANFTEDNFFVAQYWGVCIDNLYMGNENEPDKTFEIHAKKSRLIRHIEDCEELGIYTWFKFSVKTKYNEVYKLSSSISEKTIRDKEMIEKNKLPASGKCFLLTWNLIEKIK